MNIQKEAAKGQVIELSQKEVTLVGWVRAAARISVDEFSSSPVIISFHNVKFLCSEVLTSLVEARTKLKDFGSDLVIRINTKELSDLFKLVRFEQMFQIEFSV